MLGAGALFFASTTLVNAGNYGLNLLLGRWLGPAAFGELSFAVTVMLVLTLATSTVQTVVARFAAHYTAIDAQACLEGLRQWAGRLAWVLGLGMLLVLAVAAPALAHFFHLSSVASLLLLAAGMPFYFALGVDRGMLQGATRFGALTISYQAEMWVRLTASLALVAGGWGVAGATGGLLLSIIAAWLGAGAVLPRRAAQTLLDAAERRAIVVYTGPVALALAGQIIVNNSDVLLVKHFFPAEAAGQYAALALIGRVVFFATWSVVAALFPIVAQRHSRGEPHLGLLVRGLALVAAVSALIVGGAALAPDLAVRLLFGPAYLPVAPLLWLYALATALYALANVLISYGLALGRGSGGILVLAAGLAQVVAISCFHNDLRQVVLAQVVVMTALLVALLGDYVRRQSRA